MNWSEITAVFGGTFDPPHLGHREAVKGLFRLPGVKKVIVQPSGTPPLKSIFTSFEHRIKMTELAFASEPRDGMPGEIEINSGAPSNTFSALTVLKKEIAKLAFVIGTDQLELLPQWHRFPEVLSLCHWIVLQRKGAAPVEKAIQVLTASGVISAGQSAGSVGPTWKVTASGTLLSIIPTDAPEISSTLIRAEIQRTGKLPESKLSAGVMDYIRKHSVYGKIVHSSQ